MEGTDGFGFIPEAHQTYVNKFMLLDIFKAVEFPFYEKYYDSQLNFHVYRANLSSFKTPDSLIPSAANLSEIKEMPMIATQPYFEGTNYSTNGKLKINSKSIESLQGMESSFMQFVIEKYSGRTVSMNIPIQYNVYVRPGMIYRKNLPPPVQEDGWLVPLFVKGNYINYTSAQVKNISKPLK